MTETHRAARSAAVPAPVAGRRPNDLGADMLGALQVIADALAENAKAFRRRGRDCCAQESEQVLIRLREAMVIREVAS